MSSERGSGVLSGRVAIVTGASSGIGRATAALFAQEGARVVAAARRKPELDALVYEITAMGGHALALAGDVGDESFAKDVVDAALERFGALDIAFNNAGTLGAVGPTPEISAEDWASTIATNLTSGFFGAKYQIPALLRGKGGSLIFTSSFVGSTVGFPGAAAYAASKSGLIGLVQALAAEFGAQGVRVNALLPGGTHTAMGDAFSRTPEERAFVEGIHALKRIASPEEIAQSALFLASNASSFMTGSAMLVDGGVSISRT